jgi:hypothetical protein
MWNFAIGPVGGNIAMVVGMFLIFIAFVMVEKTRPGRIEGPPPEVTHPTEIWVQSEPVRVPETIRRIIPSDKAIVNVTPRDLIKFFDDHVNAQAKKLLQAYIGQWMIVPDAEVINIHDVDYGARSMVSTNANVVFTFNEDWKSRVLVLRKGAKITAVGQITGVMAGSTVELENCELLDS